MATRATLKNGINSTKSVLFRSRRMTKLILSFCGFVILLGCSKYKIAPDHEIIGDYEWGYSSNDSFESTSQDNYPDRYGIRIKENSKVYVFKNEDIIYKGKIEGMATLSSGVYYIKLIDNNRYIVNDGFSVLNYDNGLLITGIWPLADYNNYYFKK